MKIIELRKQLKCKFKQFNIEISDVDFIISEVLKVERTQLPLIENISDKDTKKVLYAVKQRLKNKPVEKIFNLSYFYGLRLFVDENVLSPRPETENLVELAIKFAKENKFKSILDLCTGSGCIAIALKKNVDAIVDASDISRRALKIAQRNANQNNVDIKLIHSNMFDNINYKYDMICSNPPYIDSKEIKMLSKEVSEFDPLLALDGGQDGLEYYKIIRDNLKNYLNENGILIMEIGENQGNMVSDLFKDFKVLDIIKDYSDNDRIVIVQNKETK